MILDLWMMVVWDITKYRIDSIVIWRDIYRLLHIIIIIFMIILFRFISFFKQFLFVCLFFVWWFFFWWLFFYWFLEFFVHKWIQSLESLCKQIFFQWQPNVFQIRKFIRNLFLFIYFHLENKSIRTINVIWKRKTIFRKNHQVNINLLFFCCCCLMILSKKMVKWISIHFLVIEMKNLKLNKCAKKQNSMKIFPLSLSHFLFDPNFWMDPIDICDKLIEMKNVFSFFLSFWIWIWILFLK